MWHTVLGAFEAGFAASLIFYLPLFTLGENLARCAAMYKL